MLWSAPDRKLWQILCAADNAAGRRPVCAAKPKQRLKRSHRGLPAVMPERELVQIHLQVVAADPMVRPDEPLLQIPDRPVRQGHDRWGAAPQGASGRLLAGHMPDVGGLHAVPPFQRVGIDGRPWRDMLTAEVQHRSLGKVRRYGQAHAARTFRTFLHRHQHDHGFAAFQLPTPPQPLLWAANPGVIDFHIAMQRLATHVDHGATQLMQDYPRCLVAPNAQLSLQQQRRDATLVGRHQVRSPKPRGQWRPGSVKHGARRQRYLVSALGAFAARPFSQRVRARSAAPWTAKALGPPTRLQVRPAGRLLGELPLEFSETGRERWARHSRTLPIVVS